MKTLLCLVTLLLLAAPLHAQNLLTGNVLSENGEALAGAVIEINGTPATTDATGTFTVHIDPADIYTMSYSAKGFYPMVHSYSPLDFHWLGKAAEDNFTVTLPAVTLVEKARGRILLAFGGDAMMGRRFSKPYEGEPVMIREEHKAADAIALLRHMKPYMELADYASVNLETQVIKSQPEGNAPKSYTFFSPPEILLAVREAGIDYVTLGNNHTNDYLRPGLESTVEALDASGLGWSGAGLNENDALRAHRAEIGGQALSFLGFVGWAGNFTPNQVAQGADKGGAAFGTTENIGATVDREVARGRLPVVQYHGSREYADEPTLVTETRLKQAIDHGAVLAVAHHPHVVQGFEIYKNRLIAYSMGNFIFDQYHYATMYSYIVYVWMDGDRLHRAEVVPIHIQGYTPMPATDTVRRSVLKRTHALSSRRGIAMKSSGGHGVIVNTQDRQVPDTAMPDYRAFTPQSSTIVPLHGMAWNTAITSVATGGAPPLRYRLGQNLLPTGHLENHYLHGSADRSWIEGSGQRIVALDKAPSGKNVMQLDIPAGQSEGRIGMRTFEYTFEPGTPTTFQTRAAFSGPAVVTAYQQWRKRGENRLDALENGRLRTIGQVEVKGDGWQELRFDFDSPRVTAISYRVVVKVEPADGATAHSSWFDDIALIEWLTPPLENGAVPPHLEVKQASHMEFLTP